MYTAAHIFLKFAKFVWLTLLISIIVGITVSLAVVPIKQLSDTTIISFFLWLKLFGTFQLVLLGISILFIFFTFASIAILYRENYIDEQAMLQKYLDSVKNINSELGLTGHIYLHSQALISVTVPLKENFIPLKAVPDRPRYDNPEEQQRQLEDGKQKHGWHNIWHHMQEEQILAGIQSQAMSIETILEECTAAHPVAVMLGAPGSGKSTCLRWLSLHMSLCSLSAKHQMPDGLTIHQVPILLHISDYAKYITEKQSTPSFQEFFSEYYNKKYPDLPRLATKLEYEMKQGRCLFLLDGLDEVPNDKLRSQVATDVKEFIARYTTGANEAKQYNRFIITSRIAGFEGSLFSSYSQYTLLGFTDKQIKGFLSAWCPAVERRIKLLQTGKNTLTTQEEASATEEGFKYRDHLFTVLQKSPSIKRLAVNPLMLTILAMLQRHSKTLPRRRSDLYNIITRTLLDNWNQDTNRSELKVEKAEHILRKLASYCHENGSYITKQEVKEIVGNSMSEYYDRPFNKRDENSVEEFIESIRRTSGLFIESGPDQFSFMHRTFQEYFVAQDLLLKKPEEFQEFVLKHCCSATWREPLLMAIAEKSKDKDKDATSNLLQTVVDNDSYDPILHRYLLFATSSIIDCQTWRITRVVQQNIVNRLFDLYGDSCGAGRYTQLQKAIEEIMLQWLFEQEEIETPLLDTWHIALCVGTHTTRQKGAVQLLALLASDLPCCSSSVLHRLIPPLLKLTRLEDLYQQELSCPAAIRQYVLETETSSHSLYIEEYALITLYLLNSHGPLGWLHEDWLNWHKRRPELLELLTQHSLELDYLLTPAAFPVHSDDPNLDKQIDIAHWKLLAQRDPHDLQTKLLQASDTARYPHAYLFKRLLESELVSPTVPWRITWDKLLKKEMSHGRSATYQACLYLRLLIHKDDNKQCVILIDELIQAISTPSQQRIQALTTTITFHLQKLRDWKFVWYLLNLPNLQYLRSTRYFRDLQDVAFWGHLHFLLGIYTLRDLLDLRYLQELKKLPKSYSQGNTTDSQYLEDLRNMADPNLRNLRKMIEPNNIISILCKALEHSQNVLDSSIVLLTLYSMLHYDTVLPETKQYIQLCLERFSLQEQTLQQTSSTEHHLIIRVITQQIKLTSSRQNGLISPSLHDTDISEMKVLKLQNLKEKRELSKKDVEGILAACNDSRRLSKEKWKDLTKDLTRVERVYELDTVEQFTWRLLSRSWEVNTEAQEVLVKALGHNDAIVCAAAALLLQHAIALLDTTRITAVKKIMGILEDDELSHRPLDPLDYFTSWRLDDVLFETLQVIRV